MDILSFKLELADLIEKHKIDLVVYDDQLLIDKGDSLELVAIQKVEPEELRK